MDTFYRATWHQFWFSLRSGEPLGLLDSSYLEDYSGQDGQITLRHLETGTGYPILLAEVPPTEEPGPHEVFRGWLPLDALPDGPFQVQGRVRDPAGNATILGAVAAPIGT